MPQLLWAAHLPCTRLLPRRRRRPRRRPDPPFLPLQGVVASDTCARGVSDVSKGDCRRLFGTGTSCSDSCKAALEGAAAACTARDFDQVLFSMTEQMETDNSRASCVWSGAVNCTPVLAPLLPAPAPHAGVCRAHVWPPQPIVPPAPPPSLQGGSSTCAASTVPSWAPLSLRLLLQSQPLLHYSHCLPRPLPQCCCCEPCCPLFAIPLLFTSEFCAS